MDEHSEPIGRMTIIGAAILASVLLLGIAGLVLIGSDDGDDTSSPPPSATETDDVEVDREQSDRAETGERDGDDGPGPAEPDGEGGTDGTSTGGATPRQLTGPATGGTPTKPGNLTTHTTTPGSSTATTIPLPPTTTPSTPLEPDRTTTASSLVSGDCVAVEDDPSYVGQVTVSDCRKPHTSEVVGGYQWPAADAYPGSDEMARQAYFDCQARFEQYVGIDFWASIYDINSIVPSAASWDEGDREITCLVVDLDGKPLEGTVRATAR